MPHLQSVFQLSSRCEVRLKSSIYYYNFVKLCFRVIFVQVNRFVLVASVQSYDCTRFSNRFLDYFFVQGHMFDFMIIIVFLMIIPLNIF